MSLTKATVAEVCTPKTAGLQRRVSALGLRSNRERLDSWKQIAVYLNREVRTVQRWEKREDLPVHRHTHLKGSTVYAFKREIDVWLTGRGQNQSEAHLVQKHSNYTANGLKPPLHVMRRKFGDCTLWFAVVERESCQSFDETVVPYVTLTPHAVISLFKGRKVNVRFGHDNWRRFEDVIHCRLLKGSSLYMLGRLAGGLPVWLRNSALGAGAR